eukprot:488103-Amphidinium_carterae.1
MLKPCNSKSAFAWVRCKSRSFGACRPCRLCSNRRSQAVAVVLDRYLFIPDALQEVSFLRSESKCPQQESGEFDKSRRTHLYRSSVDSVLVQEELERLIGSLARKLQAMEAAIKDIECTVNRPRSEGSLRKTS